MRLDTRLPSPSRWRDVPVPGGVVRVQDHVEFLRDLRNHARDTYGRALAVAIGALLLHLTPEDAR